MRRRSIVFLGAVVAMAAVTLISFTVSLAAAKQAGLPPPPPISGQWDIWTCSSPCIGFSTDAKVGTAKFTLDWHYDSAHDPKLQGEMADGAGKNGLKINQTLDLMREWIQGSSPQWEGIIAMKSVPWDSTMKNVRFRIIQKDGGWTGSFLGHPAGPLLLLLPHKP